MSLQSVIIWMHNSHSTLKQRITLNQEYKRLALLYSLAKNSLSVLL